MAAYPLLVRYNVTTPPTFSHTLDQPLYIYFSFITSILGFLQTSLLCPISFFFFYEKKVKCVPLFKLISQLLVSHTQVGLGLQMERLQGLQWLVQEDEGNHHPKTHTDLRTHENTNPRLLRLITHPWVYFGLHCRGNASCLPDREGKIVISTPLPRQVCHLQPLIKLPLVWTHNGASHRSWC